MLLHLLLPLLPLLLGIQHLSAWRCLNGREEKGSQRREQASCDRKTHLLQILTLVSCLDLLLSCAARWVGSSPRRSAPSRSSYPLSAPGHVVHEQGMHRRDGTSDVGRDACPIHERGPLTRREGDASDRQPRLNGRKRGSELKIDEALPFMGAPRNDRLNRGFRQTTCPP